MSKVRVIPLNSAKPYHVKKSVADLLIRRLLAETVQRGVIRMLPTHPGTIPAARFYIPPPVQASESIDGFSRLKVIWPDSVKLARKNSQVPMLQYLG